MTLRLRSTIALAGAFALPFAVYIGSLQPGVGYWDTGELQTVPYILGIAHPSGFPAYVLIGWVWSHVVPFGDPAYRMNVLSAAGMATAALALAGTLGELEVEPLFGLGSALVFALTRVPWEHATHADVHPVALATIGLSFWAAVRWCRTGSPRALFAGAGLAGLALAVHSGMILVVPGIALAACGRRPSLRRAFACAGLAAALAGAAYAYLPIRSAVVFAQRRDPTLALGLAPGRPFWDFDHPSTVAGFRAEVGGGQFGATTALARLADPVVLRELPVRYGETAVGDLAGGILIIALLGIVGLARRLPFATVGLAAGTLLPVLFVLAYPAESDPERYFLPSYWAIGVYVGAGAGLLARGGLSHAPRSIVAVVCALFAFVSGSNAYANRAVFAAAGDDSARRFVDRVVRETPPGTIVIAPWMYATPLAYAAYVEKRLGNRIVVTGWPGDFADHYRAWNATRPIVFVTDEPTIAVAGVQISSDDPLTPAPHLFAAHVLP